MLLSPPQCNPSAPPNRSIPSRQRRYVTVRCSSSTSSSDVAVSVESGDATPRKRPLLSRSRPPRPYTVKDEELVPGKIIKGSVKAISPFGAFIDLSARFDGLLHISKIADQFVQNVGDFVTVGHEIEVVIESVDLVKRRIVLNRHRPPTKTLENGARSSSSNGASARAPALKQTFDRAPRSAAAAPAARNGSGRTGRALFPLDKFGTSSQLLGGSTSTTPNRSSGAAAGENEFSRAPPSSRNPPAKASYRKGQVVTGMVKNYTRRGCFVQLPGNQEGFLHSNEIEAGAAREGEPVPIENLVELGQEIKVKVLRMIDGRINLTMKGEVDVSKINEQLNEDVAAAATNPFELAFRKNPVIRSYLRESGKLADTEWEVGGYRVI